MSEFNPPRQFVPSDVNTADDPKIMAAGDRAELLFRRGNDYCKRVGNDGILPKTSLPAFAFGIQGRIEIHANKLVEVGLWEDLGENYRVTSFLRWNPSQAEIRDLRERKKVGSYKTNHKRGRHADDPQNDCPLCIEEGLI